MADPAILPTEVARQVIDPHAYAAWDPLLDTFDRLREESPVAKIVPEEEGLFEPFWLITRYDDVMRISKDNATFLNNPKPVVFSFTKAIEFSRAATERAMQGEEVCRRCNMDLGTEIRVPPKCKDSAWLF